MSKSSPRIEAIGDIDELNSVIGLVRAHIVDTELDGLLEKIQRDLFTLGADTASLFSVESPRVKQSHVDDLEQLCNRFIAQLEPLEDFVLPGGAQAGAAMHIARAVTRRVERRLVFLSQAEEVNPLSLVYLNRLSDLLFVLARVKNHRDGVPEKMIDFGKRD